MHYAAATPLRFAVFRALSFFFDAALRQLLATCLSHQPYVTIAALFAYAPPRHSHTTSRITLHNAQCTACVMGGMKYIEFCRDAAYHSLSPPPYATPKIVTRHFEHTPISVLMREMRAPFAFIMARDALEAPVLIFRVMLDLFPCRHAADLPLYA